MMDNLISYSTILYEQIACVEDKQTELVSKLIKDRDRSSNPRRSSRHEPDGKALQWTRS